MTIFVLEVLASHVDLALSSVSDLFQRFHNQPSLVSWNRQHFIHTHTRADLLIDDSNQSLTTLENRISLLFLLSYLCHSSPVPECQSYQPNPTHNSISFSLSFSNPNKFVFIGETRGFDSIKSWSTAVNAFNRGYKEQ